MIDSNTCEKILTKEDWLPILDYSEYYNISSHGRVYSKKSNKQLNLHLKDGYLIVHLSKSGTTKSFRVHRLVAIAFIPNINNYNVVDHINGDRSFNFYNNLRWCTHQQNLNFYRRPYNQIERQEKKDMKSKPSGIIGVSWSASKKRWVARHTKQGVSKFIGSHKFIDPCIELYMKYVNSLNQ